MTVEKVLLFPGPKGKADENDIKEVERVLESFGIGFQRYGECDNEDYDAIIALGGDGTMLNASGLAYRRKKPVMSINFGTLGYMSCLEKSELSMLSLLKSGFSTEKRMLLNIKLQRDGKTVAEATALNEAVILRHADGDMATVSLKCDGASVCDYRADGLIISTPTGSSAYVLSAGGPIIDTKLDAFCVCPICPHALAARSMVFSPNSVIEAVNNSRSQNNLLIADGKTVCELENGDRIVITKSDEALEMIKLKKDAFYETLYNKMS